MAPKFSIAIPAHNRREYLRQAVQSCLAQTTDDFEVIISDDCSTDDLRAVAESFCDPRITCSRSDTCLKAAANHQRAVSLSQGQYVVNLHSDDMLLPNCLEVAGAALDRNEEAAAVYSSMAILDGATISGCQPVPKIRFADSHVYSTNPWLEKHHNVAPSCCMFRKTAFERLGGYRVFLRFAYDWDLYMRFMTAGSGVLFLPEVLTVYRRHDDQASRTVAQEGLYDILDLWQLREYSHWPSSEIATLALSELMASIRRRKGLLQLLQQIGRSGVAWRLARGGGEAIRSRVYHRREKRANMPDSHYELPANLDRALQAATVLVSASN